MQCKTFAFSLPLFFNSVGVRSKRGKLEQKGVAKGFHIFHSCGLEKQKTTLERGGKNTQQTCS